MKPGKFLSLALASLLQLTPVARVAVLGHAAAPAGSAILLKWIATAAVTLGAVDAVSGASTVIAGVRNQIGSGNPLTMNAIGTVGQSFRYRIILKPAATPNPAQDFYDATPLPPGLSIVTTPGGDGVIFGTPTVDGVTTPVTISANNTIWQAAGGTGISTNITITINPVGSDIIPVILTEPVSQTVAVGGAISLTVVADGTPTPDLQWYKDLVAIQDATNSTYSVSTAALSDAGSYTVVATNRAGSITSFAAVVTVQDTQVGPAITTQPSSLTVTNTQAASFSVVATGTPAPTYQWAKGGVAIAGATSATYSIASASAANAGSYTVTVSNVVGSVTSTPATLTVNSIPAITTQPRSLTVNQGASATFSVTATGTPAPTYQWRKGTAVIPGATGSSFTIASAQSTDAGSYTVVVSNSVASVTSSAATLTVTVVPTQPTLVGWCDRGVNETDTSDYSVFMMLPPAGSLRAQFMMSGKLVTNATGYTVTYQAVADSTGSINSTSQGKGNYFQYASLIFGRPIAPDSGLAGFNMPGKTNTPQPMVFDSAQKTFVANAVPVTPYDDAGNANRNPLFRLTVKDASGKVLDTTDVSIPITDKMDCRACHVSGANEAARPYRGWEWECDSVRDYKLNVLLVHDQHYVGNDVYTAALKAMNYNPNGLYDTVTKDGRPILCLGCHSSTEYSWSGQPGVLPLTQVMHNKHAFNPDPDTHVFLNNITNSAACLRCHAGPEREYVRGVHHRPVDSLGGLAISCQSCHGKMLDVGSAKRQGHLDMPMCQSCHTGTASSNAGSLAFTSVFDVTNHVRTVSNQTFATKPNTPSAGHSTFRDSTDHGALHCQACHGSAHAETPSLKANDNVQSIAMQGQAGPIITCAACHPTTVAKALNGPHGTHPATASLASSHSTLGAGRTACQACHGTDYRGTALSRARTTQTFSAKGTHTFWAGAITGCYNCHNGPGSDNTNPNRPPVTVSLSASTLMETPVSVTLSGTDADANPLTYRVVTQPLHGTALLVGNVATYRPEAGYSGSDSFTYTARDNQSDGNLSTVSLTVTAGPCVVTASATAPLASLPNDSAKFRSLASLAGCNTPLTYDWDFGDGSPHATSSAPCHTYTAEGVYTWTSIVSAGASSVTNTGSITISTTMGPPLTLTITSFDTVMLLQWPWDPIPCVLETSTDWTQPFSWLPTGQDAFMDENGIMNAYVDALTATQSYRLRRLP